jgi:ribosomal protein S18 acetylase RimI-like enzyme
VKKSEYKGTAASNGLKVVDVVVRDSAAKDWKGVLEIERACFPKADWIGERGIQRFCKNAKNKSKVLVAENTTNGQLLGVLIGVHWPKQNLYRIIVVGVLPGYQRLGVAKKLLKDFLDWSRARGIGRIHAEVKDGNVKSTDMFIRFRFRPAHKVMRVDGLYRKYRLYL